jgi:hypothetical protein
MDLRFEAFNLIDRDPVLRALLLNYANRLQYAGPSNATANDDCFLVLTWTGGEQVDAPTGTQVLTAEAHLPRSGWSECRYLDFVLQRLAAALAHNAAKRVVTARCVATSRQVREGDDDTIFKSSTFEIAPTRSRIRASGLPHLAPWRACADPGVVDLMAASPRGASLN